VGSNSGVDRVDRNDDVIIGDDGINGDLRLGGNGSGFSMAMTPVSMA
jgi:hypothetical protein